MATTTSTAGPTTRASVGAERAFVLLRTVFTIAPIAFGVDKFTELLTSWDKYLAPWVNDLVPGNAHQAMLAVGVVEIVAGIAVELLQAVRSGDTSAFDTAKLSWYANADDIADFLAQANPRHWPQATMRAAMRGHLDQTLAEASHELTGNYAQSVADYDEIHHHILGMADLLSSGIIRAFPHRFH